jgi:hypothetical protein
MPGKIITLKKLYFLFLGILLLQTLHAQHTMHRTGDSNVVRTDTVPPQGLSGMNGHLEMPSHSFSRNLPMSRNASGTGWNPDASPMYMWMVKTRRTDWMFHGNIFVRYVNTDVFTTGDRGGEKLSAPNWFMVMMNHKVGNRGLLNATAMISLDRLTEGESGYPLLFQTGETVNGKRLVDRQHPHDLVSGLTLGYTQMLTKDLDLFAYVGYPGEPALGATAFMHRTSAMNDPDGPLSHHWQDATHITFGVATVGIRYKRFKLEGSSFTGREPDEDRYNFDKARFDSYSYRLSYNPSRNWALQFSQGFIQAPEPLEPGKDVTRTSASLLYANSLGMHRHLSAALIWGYNNWGKNDHEHAVLLEGNYQLGKNALFSRYEFVQKSADELDLVNQIGDALANIHVFSLGYNRSIWQSDLLETTIGLKGTVDFVPGILQPIYGKMPVGAQVILQIRPPMHTH